jgi:energy-coupling factor transporter ATP-binding protein EcfA2
MARGRPKKKMDPKADKDCAKAPVLIALCGPKGSGKTTVAKMANPTAIISFAGPLKALAKSIFNLTDEQIYGSQKEVPFPEPKTLTELQVRKIVRFMANEIIAIRNQGAKAPFSAHAVAVNKIMRGPFVSPRDLMQKLGTEIMQNIYKPFSPLVALWPHKDKPGIYVVDDMRFPLEDELARDMFEYYYPVRITGRNEDVKDGHASEQAWKQIKFFSEIDSSGDIKELELRAVEVFSHIQTDIKLRLEKESK